MKLGEEIIVGGRKASEKAEGQNSENKNSKDSGDSFMEKLAAISPFLPDIAKFIAAIIVASITYFIASVAISEEMNYFLRHLLCLVLSIMALFAFNTVQKTIPVIGRAVVILLLLFFIYKTTDHYFGQPKENKVEKEIQAENKPIVKKGDVMVLHPGHYRFELKNGESTMWMKFPKGEGILDYSCSSPNYSYQTIIAGKPNPYKGGEGTKIPLTKDSFFKIQALANDTIFIVITRHS